MLICAKSPLIVPGAASFGEVAPTNLLAFSTACTPSTTKATTGPSPGALIGSQKFCAKQDEAILVIHKAKTHLRPIRKGDGIIPVQGVQLGFK